MVWKTSFCQDLKPDEHQALLKVSILNVGTSVPGLQCVKNNGWKSGNMKLKPNSIEKITINYTES